MENWKSLMTSASSQIDYVEEWYPFIKDFTFKTWAIPFTIEEAHLLYSICESTTYQKPIDKSQSTLFSQFKTKIEAELDKIKLEIGSECGFFLRLGSRSLKDAVYSAKSSKQRFKKLMYHAYEEEFSHFQSDEEKGAWVDKNGTENDYRIFSRCEIMAYQCHRVEEMFDMFCRSQRIRSDLKQEFEKESPKFFLIIREWDNRICFHLEFRGFVYHHKLTGLSQYDQWVYYEEVDKNKEAILNAIQKYFQSEIRDKLSNPECSLHDGNYIIDFGVIFHYNERSEVENVEVIVIEINLFYERAGPCLFNWEKDIEVLIGNRPFEFRFVTKNQFAMRNYEAIIFPHVLGMIGKIKKQIVQSQKKNFCFVQ